MTADFSSPDGSTASRFSLQCKHPENVKGLPCLSGQMEEQDRPHQEEQHQEMYGNQDQTHHSSAPDEAAAPEPSQTRTLAGQVSQGNSNNSSGTFGVPANESEQMKIFVTNANVTYHTRHARRIYVGGIPPNYSDEEELRNFFNKVIAKGLGIENDNSFVISVYMNQKKCYAFVEFSSIELTTACLEMDGIIFKKVTLKIYRANEYRPELVPPTKFLKLDLTGWSFGLATGAGAAGNTYGTNPALNGPSGHHRINSGNSNHNLSPMGSWMGEEPPSPVVLNDCIAALIQFTNIASMEPGSLVIVGFPYETITAKPVGTPPNSRAPHRGVGTAGAPACLRKCLTTCPGAMIYNAELGLDLSLQSIMDVGDVLAGQSRNETKALLSTTVSELLLRGSVPFLIGGSRDQSYYSAMGLLAATGVCVGVMNVSAQVDSKILDCPEFCAPTSHVQLNANRNTTPNRGQNCYGRYVQFGAQGAQCNAEVARGIVDRGGHIFWLHKDLRTASTESIAVAQFSRALRNLDACVQHDQQRKGTNVAALRNAFPQAFMMVTIDCGVLAGIFNPHAGSSHSSVGLTAEELLEFAYIAGAHPNVAMFEVTEFKPDSETDSRVNMFLADIFYKFALGVASRTQQLRGGALGAGAVALASGVSGLAVSAPGAPPVILPGGAQAQYGNRAPVGAAAANKRVAYVPENTNSRYNPARDPAVILQQQQMQHQQLLQQQSQGAVPGRVPYTPQQLQVQQQQMLQQQQQLMQNRATQQQAPPPAQRGGPHGPGASYAAAGDQQGMNMNRGAPQQQHQRGVGSHTQSPSMGGMSYPADESLLGPNDPSGLQWLQPQQSQSHGGFQASARQNAGFNVLDDSSSVARQGNHGRPPPILTQTGSAASMGSGGESKFGHGQGQSFQRPPTGSSFLNPGAATFQSDNSKWGNGNFTPSGSFGTSTSAHTAVSSFPSNEWLNTGGAGDSGRFSALSSNSSGMTLRLPSMSSGSQQSNAGTSLGASSLGASLGAAGLFSSGSIAPNSSFRTGGPLELSGYDDAMDKLIGVTNIGHIPSFDDPLDPQYQED